MHMCMDNLIRPILIQYTSKVSYKSKIISLMTTGKYYNVCARKLVNIAALSRTADGSDIDRYAHSFEIFCQR